MYYVVKNKEARGKFDPMFFAEAFLWGIVLEGEVVEEREFTSLNIPLLRNKCRVLPGEVSPVRYALLTSFLGSSKAFLEGDSLGRQDRRTAISPVRSANELESYVKGYYTGYELQSYLKGYCYGYHGGTLPSGKRN